MSDPNLVSVTERALELARSGICHTVEDIRRQLMRERYDMVNSHLAGRSIKTQLKRILAERAGQPDV